jgi:hypothetical protein
MDGEWHLIAVHAMARASFSHPAYSIKVNLVLKYHLHVAKSFACRPYHNSYRIKRTHRIEYACSESK